jgi:ketosteroid isomerase-like protein
VQNAEVSETPESRKAVFRRLVEMYATGDLAGLDEVIAPDYVGHVSAGDRDLDGFRESIKYFHNLFIYAKDSFRVEDQLVDGEKVATRMTARVQVRATGEHITLVGINIARIVRGRLVEEWNTWEQLQGENPAAGAPSLSWMPG